MYVHIVVLEMFCIDTDELDVRKAELVRMFFSIAVCPSEIVSTSEADVASTEDHVKNQRIPMFAAPQEAMNEFER